jgi:hypothetical protein
MVDKLLIHQIAPKDTSIWHPFWSKCHESWKEHYEVVLWNDQKDIDNLIHDHYPKWWNVYQAFPFHVMKIDFARLAILHRHGGMYADMDVFCYQPIPDKYLQPSFAPIENLTTEYTTARFENSLMYSEKHNPLLPMLMDYVKMLFINSRNHFEKPYKRTVKNDNLINNITGSGMLTAGMTSFRQTGYFSCRLFNNRPAAYDSAFYTKHAHSSIWGNEYLNKQDCNTLLIVNGLMYQVDQVSDKLRELLEHESHYILPVEEFDFRTDYTNGVYIRDDSEVTKINSYIQDVTVRFHDYFDRAKATT